MSDDKRDEASQGATNEVMLETPELSEQAEASPSKPPSSSSQPPSGVPAGWRPSYVFLLVVTFINLAADLVTKQWVKAHFDSLGHLRRAKIEVIEGVMNVIYATNKGGAWGLLQNETDSLRRPFFLVVSVGAIVFIVSLYRKLMPSQRALKWGLPLVLGGALGNLIDRIVYGFVIDFIDVIYWSAWSGGGKHWPTFNIADVSICVGVGLMAIDMFSSRKPEPEPATAEAGASGPDSVPLPRPAVADAKPAPSAARAEPPAEAERSDVAVGAQHNGLAPAESESSKPTESESSEPAESESSEPAESESSEPQSEPGPQLDLGSEVDRPSDSDASSEESSGQSASSPADQPPSKEAEGA